ncbi:hypothetical protein Tco_0360189 [Tanacetum coccineum]
MGVLQNMRVYTPYPRKDTFTPLTKTPKEILAMESVSFPEPPPLIETPKKHNLNKLCDYHGDRGHNTNDYYQLKKQIEEVVASGEIGSSSEGHPPKQPAEWEPRKERGEGSLEDIPSSNTIKIEYLYTKENNIQEKIKIKL